MRARSFVAHVCIFMRGTQRQQQWNGVVQKANGDIGSKNASVPQFFVNGLTENKAKCKASPVNLSIFLN